MVVEGSIPPPVSSSEVSKPKSHKNQFVAVLVIAVVIVGIVAYWWFLQWDFGYTRIKVVKGNTVTHEFGGIEYDFYLGPQRRIQISAGSGGYYLSEPNPGNRYDALGLEVIIVEIYDDYAVLKVKPL